MNKITHFPHITVSTNVSVDTMDLAWVCHRLCRHRSVVRDFTVSTLAPTVFYLELLNLQVMFSFRKSYLGIFLASFRMVLKNHQSRFFFFAFPDPVKIPLFPFVSMTCHK